MKFHNIPLTSPQKDSIKSIIHSLASKPNTDYQQSWVSWAMVEMIVKGVKRREKMRNWMNMVN